MQLDHTFTVPVTTDRAWEALLDFERVAPCLPGATLAGMDGDVLEGAVKVKLGPVMLNYLGTATILERDAGRRVMVMDGRAKDARGNGTAAARITARLEEVDRDSTAVHVTTELDVTGRPAQFGRGLMQDVSNKIVGQFATRLADELTQPRAAAVAAPATPSAAASTAAPLRPVAPAENPPLDLGSVLPQPTPLQAAVLGAIAALTGLAVLRKLLGR
ncbi:carbon monoxide dehydrogenase [Pimelobacter simplex]|uniref:Carbon monoxide oxidation accessory protein CoxG n=1 Tax=Nocardioides simplex TaxID=2045 RepID=A0A0A1DPX0_NOCSI|nr:SRPBCC family protein [Pimelobacter simplex]AIY19456.1 Carbon monoxide oxidation accessory protein CoxG [Pimelobacter simplex]MCG8149631.1 carbon monoxide dehydrogenase [Pimelobacter simplex]GEB16005.1 carbon monoxide dehydrogenase subunit G [Pimelobacter simplex]SFM82348.1 Carbon monoxide dehydrogenase subunit G [Pimelobacter simplex]